MLCHRSSSIIRKKISKYEKLILVQLINDNSNTFVLKLEKKTFVLKLEKTFVLKLEKNFCPKTRKTLFSLKIELYRSIA